MKEKHYGSVLFEAKLTHLFIAQHMNESTKALELEYVDRSVVL